ncbi:hypothetical protein CASFOL_040060 [Castilleja foliolosa]|uniref:PAP/OAS1 substrate-binding-related domain-containing protein n=1 Tax=Castilleja foliolosa TaxID=1961234 RepID=A0ABD3BFC4_9LAMI
MTDDSIFSISVFPYRSVPLKTYLPDGDIDLTTFGCSKFEDTLAENIKLILEEEERNASSVFVVKDVQLILLRVRIVKCIVELEDIVVNISFNQIGGLCTLCFLEQPLIVTDVVEHNQMVINVHCFCTVQCPENQPPQGYRSSPPVIGKNLHGGNTVMFEPDMPERNSQDVSQCSPRMDAHPSSNGSFDQPEKVGVFDWEAYCISLSEPVCVSLLPAFIVEMPEGSDTDLLLSSEFLTSCIGMFSVPAKIADISRGFQQQHLNIFDPLKDINNLCRSVSKAN